MALFGLTKVYLIKVLAVKVCKVLSCCARENENPQTPLRQSLTSRNKKAIKVGSGGQDRRVFAEADCDDER